MNENELHPEMQTAETDIIPSARKAYTFSQLNIALFFVFYLSLSLIVTHFLPANASNALNYITRYGIMYLIAFPFYLLISRRLETCKPEKHKMTFFQIIKAFFVCELIGITGNLLGMVINAFLSVLLGFNTSSNFLVGGIFGEGSLLFMFLAVVCAPFVEEMLFRKILIDRIAKYGNKTAILISGIMFGLFHGNFTQAFYAAMLGMLFAFIYIRTGRIQYTILLHMCVNFWGTVMPYLTLRNHDINAFINAVLSMERDTVFSMLHEMRYFLMLTGTTYTLAFFGLIVLILNRKKLTVPQAVSELPKGRRFVTACCNFGFLALLAVCAYQFIRQLVALM